MASSIGRKSIPNELQNGGHNLPPRKLTAIQSFFSGKNVFITGGTGFLGKLLLEKLLWSCPDIGDIYLLVREKKGKDLQTRVDDLVDSPAFSRVKRDVPGYLNKIRAIAGDCSIQGLGISQQDRNILVSEVHVVFHVAATVRFSEPLPLALAINVRATKDMIEMAREMKNLASFVHVSTAFSQCYESTLEERFYDSPMDPMMLLDFVQTANPDIIDSITPSLIGKWPNTYTFTKALAEDFLRVQGIGMPLGIFRPSIVVSSLEEPVPRWVDNWYGVSGFITACGTGLLRAVRANRQGVANVVPVDMCINGLIAAAWDVADRYKDIKTSATLPTSRDIRLYNYVLGDKHITWGEIYDTTVLHAKFTCPPSRALWYTVLFMQPGARVHQIARFFLHYIPGLLADTASVCIGRKAEFLKLYAKIDMLEDVTVFFSTKTWNFSNANMPKLLARMSAEDRKLYFCDMGQIHWVDFLKTYFLGVRRYLLKDDDSTIPAARRKYYKLYILHRTLQLVFFFLTLRGIYKAAQLIKRVRAT